MLLIKYLIKRLYLKIRLWLSNECSIASFFREQGMQIGNDCRIFIKSFGSEPYLVKIGNHCTITSGVSFITHDGGAWVFRQKITDLNVFGKIEIKDNCFIGARSIILPNVTIGPNAVVGAGSVVTRDVPPNTVVAGVPAKIICSIEEYEKKCIQKWQALKLNGPRKTWKKQLIKYFWENRG